MPKRIATTGADRLTAYKPKIAPLKRIKAIKLPQRAKSRYMVKIQRYTGIYSKSRPTAGRNTADCIRRAYSPIQPKRRRKAIELPKNELKPYTGQIQSHKTIYSHGGKICRREKQTDSPNHCHGCRAPTGEPRHTARKASRKPPETDTTSPDGRQTARTDESPTKARRPEKHFFKK